MKELPPKPKNNFVEKSTTPEVEVTFDREKHKAEKSQSYAEAGKAITRFIEVVPEAEEILYRERPAKTTDERVMGEYELLLESLHGLKKSFEDQHNEHKACAVAMYTQKIEGEKTKVGLYLDAKRVNPEFASLIVEDSPFIKKVLENVEEKASEDLPQVDFVE